VKKSFLFLLVIVALSALFLFFITKKLEDAKPEVVVVLKELDTQYWKIVEAGAKKGFRDFGIDGKVIAPSSKSAQEDQEKILNEILNEKPDVLVVAPVNSYKYKSILEKFVDNKIPVLLLDTNIPLENKSSYIGTDNYELGRKAGALLASELQPGDEVALIAGISADPVSGDRLRGAKSSLEAVGIESVTEKVDLPNESSRIKKAIREVLQHHPNVKGVFATSDIMALSALEELEKQGYKIPVIGTDGTTEMVELVEEGELSSTVAQNPYDMGYLSAQAAMNIAKGKNVDTIIDSGVDYIIKGNGNERLTFLKKILK
jgi:ribose transport system substrate-binding protein